MGVLISDVTNIDFMEVLVSGVTNCNNDVCFNVSVAIACTLNTAIIYI